MRKQREEKSVSDELIDGLLEEGGSGKTYMRF